MIKRLLEKYRLPKLFIVLLLFSVFVPFICGAQVRIENPLEYNTFWELLDAIVGFMMLIAAPIASLAIVVAGYHFVFSKGDPEKVKTARNIIIWTLIGLLIILSAWTIIGVIRSIFGR